MSNPIMILTQPFKTKTQILHNMTHNQSNNSYIINRIFNLLICILVFQVIITILIIGMVTFVLLKKYNDQEDLIHLIGDAY